MTYTKPSIADLESTVARERYDAKPLAIVEDFLKAFNTSGELVFGVPAHILVALAARFRTVMGPENTSNSLDEAFGGRIARQRNSLRAADEDFGLAFNHTVARQKAKTVAKTDRVGGTPFELATASVADATGMSEENVRRRYKRAKTSG